MNDKIKKTITDWLEGPYDKDTKKQIKLLQKDDEKELEEAFSKNLVFGTGGMRGVMGPGINRMNIYTVQSASQGLANYLLSKPEVNKRIFISYDSRNFSKEFATAAASVFAANGIKAFITSELRPTPFVSFSCRYLKCGAAVMITASHNPPEYNGYKVYFEDGAQIVAPHDTAIIKEVEKITSIDMVKKDSGSELICPIGSEIDQAYFKAISSLTLNERDNQENGHKLNLVFSNLHGTGITLLPGALSHWGFTSLECVEEQIQPDGDFPTANSPNPEDPNALGLGMDLLLSNNADLLFTTDPDADRLGVVVNQEGSPIPLTGNQVASLCVDYILSKLKQNKTLPKNGACVSTIVSTKLQEQIAKAYQITYIEVLTGFKYIGQKINEWDTNEKHTFLFGAEESYGYLYGTHSRDKDAIVSACLISKIALDLKKQGRTLYDRLLKLYRQYGIFREGQVTKKMALHDMQSLMEKFRTNPPKQILATPIKKIVDYQKGIKDLPKSNVLAIYLEDHSKFIIRPSGTEPKIKIYGMMVRNFHKNLDEEIIETDSDLYQYLDALLALC